MTGPMRVFTSTSEKSTKKLAKKILKEYPDATLFCLYGDLGSGKTIFCKGLALAIGIPEKKIKSPTYTLIHTFGGIFYHCDFYRINKPDELISGQLEEIFTDRNAITAIEWPERIEKLLPEKRLNLYFKYHNKSTRIIKILTNEQ